MTLPGDGEEEAIAYTKKMEKLYSAARVMKEQQGRRRVLPPSQDDELDQLD